MTTYRTHKETGRFMILDKTCIRDSNLSLKAKGLLITMLEKPDDWIFYESKLVESCKDGRDSVRSGIKELEEAGYLKRMRERDDKGRLSNYDYDVYETPTQIGLSNIGKTNVGKSGAGKTNIGKSDTTNNNLTKNNNTNNNLTKNDLNDLNDKESNNSESHTDHTNHSNQQSDNIFDESQEEKEVLLQSLPQSLKSYLMKYDLSEIKSIKSSLLKAKESFYKEVEVEERMTIEDIEEYLIAALKRINSKKRKTNEQIEHMEPYMFTTFKRTFFSRLVWNDDDEDQKEEAERFGRMFDHMIASGY